MKQDYLKYFHPKALISIVLIIGVLIYLAKEYGGIAVPIIYGITASLIVISTILWKYKPFIWLFWVDDFSGRYEGKLKYQYRDELGELKTGELIHVKLINQNGHRIIISSFTIKANGEKSSLSVSKGMFVEKTEDDRHYRLIYNYQNDGSTEQGFPPHYGTEVIKFIKNGGNKILSGGYYTGREPFQTRGEFSELKWVSNDLNHEF